MRDIKPYQTVIFIAEESNSLYLSTSSAHNPLHKTFPAEAIGLVLDPLPVVRSILSNLPFFC